LSKDLIIIGKITKSHGLSGEFRVFSMSEDLFFYDQKPVYLLKNSSPESLYKRNPFMVDYMKGDSARPIMHLEGINSIEAVKEITRFYLAVERASAHKLKEDEYYFADLIGMQVRLDNGTDFGTVGEVFENSCQEMLSIISKGREYLVPFVKEWVLKADTENKLIIIDHRFFSDEKD